MEMIGIDKKFWKNKRVLITGFEGFLGSNLARALVQANVKVVGLDIKTFRKQTILNSQDYKKLIVFKGSVTNRKLIRDILRKHSINVIFHLAAEAIVGRGQQNPLKAFESNIAGTWEVLEAARQQGNIQVLIVASSDKAYGSHKKLPYQEGAPLIANYPYDVSKSCADLVANTYFHTYGLPVAVTRCGNIYGPGDFNFSRIVPGTIRCMLSDEELLIRSDGKFTRDYVYVKDIVDGYILLADSLVRKRFAGEVFNFSNEKPVTVKCLVEKIYKLAGKKPLYRILNKVACEIRHQYLASGKARRLLRWKPAYNLEEGLKETINWYSNYLGISKII